MTLRTSIFTSLDGRIDADSDWQYPWFDGELFEVLAQQWSSADALLIGRRSFEGYERLAVEHPGSPMVDLLRSLPVIVVSRTRDSSDSLPGATFIATADPTSLAALEETHGRLLVLGNPTLLNGLVGSGSVTTLDVIVLPVVLGGGARLFESVSGPVAFTTREARSLSSGAIVLELDAAGAAPTA